MSASAAPALPGMLAANPRLDQWVRFASPGQVTVSTGRVEIGQGVLTAMRQIAAEELDVSPERILLQTGDTELTPNEGYTAGSQSIQFGGVALRLACAEVRGLFLDHAAAQFGHARAELSVGAPMVLAWFIGGIVAGAFALVWGHPTLRLRGPYFSIATIGVGEATRLVCTYWD